MHESVKVIQNKLRRAMQSAVELSQGGTAGNPNNKKTSDCRRGCSQPPGASPVIGLAEETGL
jgi:hypothetical protein